MDADDWHVRERNFYPNFPQAWQIAVQEMETSFSKILKTKMNEKKIF